MALNKNLKASLQFWLDATFTWVLFKSNKAQLDPKSKVLLKKPIFILLFCQFFSIFIYVFCNIEVLVNNYSPFPFFKPNPEAWSSLSCLCWQIQSEPAKQEEDKLSSESLCAEAWKSTVPCSCTFLSPRKTHNRRKLSAHKKLDFSDPLYTNCE